MSLKLITGSGPSPEPPATAVVATELEVVSRPPSQTERQITKLYSDLSAISKEVGVSILKATNKALPIAVKLGGLLIEHKERLGHGNWEGWVDEQPFSLSTAKPAEVRSAHEPEDIKPPAQPSSTEPVSGNGESLTALSDSTESMLGDSTPSRTLNCYKVDTIVTIRLTRYADANNEEEAIRIAQRAHGEGLGRYFKGYQNCDDDIQICSIEWKATA